MLNTLFEGRPLLKQMLENASWLTFEKIFRLSLTLLVSIFLARFLGPEKFGLFSYAISVVALLGSFVYLGLSGLVVRDLAAEKYSREELLGTTFLLKAGGGGSAFLFLLLFVFSGWHAEAEASILAIVAFSILFRPFEVIELWFQSQTQARYSVWARIISSVLAASANLILLSYQAPIAAYAGVYSVEILAVALLLVTFYHRQGGRLLAWRWSTGLAKTLLGQSWVLILSGALAAIYLKVDQVMLRWLVGSREVGVYSVAVQFSEVWYFLPAAIAVSVYPALVKIRQKSLVEYEQKLQTVFNCLFGLALVVSLVVTAVAQPVIGLLYGEEYAGAGMILSIHIWAGIFIFMRALLSKWLIIENLLKVSLLTHAAGAVVNVLLNLVLIRFYGGIGAAVSTLLAYAVASYFSLFLIRETRGIALMMSRSLALPLRIFSRVITRKTG